MSLSIHKSHHVTVMVYYLVCPTKYRRIVVTKKVDQTIKETCLAIRCCVIYKEEKWM